MGCAGNPHAFNSVFLWPWNSSTNSSLSWKSPLSDSQVVGCMSHHMTHFPIAQVLNKPSPLELWTCPTLWWSSGGKSVQLINILSPGKRACWAPSRMLSTLKYIITFHSQNNAKTWVSYIHFPGGKCHRCINTLGSMEECVCSCLHT